MPVFFCADESIGVAGALSSLVDYKQNWQLLLAAVSAVGFDSAAGPATAGACGAVAGVPCKSSVKAGRPEYQVKTYFSPKAEG